MPFFYTDSGSFNILEVTGSTILSGSLIVSGATNFGPTGLTGSLLGSSSFATTSSAATSITFTPTTASFATTSSAATSITFTPPTASFSTTASAATSITFTPSTASFSTTASAATSITFTPSSASFASTASFVNTLTTLTASNVQLNNLTDTTATNKVLVLDTTTNKIFTTASVGGGGGSTPAGTISASVSGDSQGQIKLNGVNVNITTLQTNSNPSFTGLTSNAQLIVSGSTGITHGLVMSRVGWLSSFRMGAISSSGDDLWITNNWNPQTNAQDSAEAGYLTLAPKNELRSVINGTSATTLTSTGLGIGTKSPNAKLDVAGNQILSGSLLVTSSVSASSYTSSLNNQVGYFGTSSWAVSSSRAITASFAQTAISASYFSGSATFPDGLTVASLTSSVAQLTGLTDTTAANKILVLNTATNQIFTTASAGGGGGTGTGFPFSGSAVITGSLLISGSGLQVIGNGITGSVTSGSLFNIIELSMAVSGTIAANATTTVTLDLNQANYFSISGSATGTVTWQITNPPATGRAQTFVMEYTNGGIKTNNWFTNTRWPAGVAPSLTSASANPDLLGFTTDDAGSNWRGVLLQRGSA